jgi:hypothetical protein
MLMMQPNSDALTEQNGCPNGTGGIHRYQKVNGGLLMLLLPDSD